MKSWESEWQCNTTELYHWWLLAETLLAQNTSAAVPSLCLTQMANYLTKVRCLRDCIKLSLLVDCSLQPRPRAKTREVLVGMLWRHFRYTLNYSLRLFYIERIQISRISIRLHTQNTPTAESVCRLQDQNIWIWLGCTQNLSFLAAVKMRNIHFHNVVKIGGTMQTSIAMDTSQKSQQ